MKFLENYNTLPSEFWPDYREIWQTVDMHGTRVRRATVTIVPCKDTCLDMFKVRWDTGTEWASAECYFLEEAHELLQSHGFELIDRVNLD